MTPFVQILNLIEQRRVVRRSELSALMGRTAETALAQLCERGDIRRIARGVYALPGTPNLPKARA
jgi:DeoR/GlpR family transcriptional regulator of sugar metabolism